MQLGYARRIQRESGALISNRRPVADFYRPIRSQFHRVLAWRDIERVTLVAVFGQNAHPHHAVLTSRRPELQCAGINRSPKTAPHYGNSERRWSEPVPGRELHPLESGGFHGGLLQQLRESPCF